MKGCKLLVFVCLAGCSSLHEQAQESFDTESYEQAASLYEDILAKKPTDKEALGGLKKSREESLKKRLVQIRLLRFAGQNQESIDELLRLKNDQRSWRQIPLGPSAFAQKEEVDFSFRFLKSQIKHYMKQKYFLKAKEVMSYYQPLFVDRDYKESLAQLERELRVGGGDKCRKFKKQARVSQVHFSNFVTKYCEVFALAQNLPLSVSVQSDSYGHVDFDRKQSAFSPAEAQTIASSLRRALQKSPWYSPQGRRRLFVDLKGRFKYGYKRQKIRREHTYVDYVSSDKKSTGVDALDALIMVVDVAAALTGESREAPVSQPKYKMVEKTVPYPAIYHTEEFNLYAGYHLRLNQKRISGNYVHEEEHHFISHSQELPDVGLFPIEPKPIGRSDWLRGQAELIEE